MLATRMFFWDWGITPPPPVSIPEVPAPLGHGSGKGRGEYTPLTDEEWLARETHMRANLPSERTPETVYEKRMRYAQELRAYKQQDQQLSVLRDQLEGALQQLRAASTIDELTQLATVVKQLRMATGELDKSHRAHLTRIKSLRFQLLN